MGLFDTSSTSTTRRSFAKPIQPFVDQILGEFNATGTQREDFAVDERLAGFNPTQLSAFRGLAGGGRDAAAGGAEVVDFGRGLLAGEGLGVTPELEAFITAATNPIGDRLIESTLPGIGGAAESVGGLGGARQGILEATAIRNADRQASDVASNIAFSAFERGRDRQLAAPGLIAGGNDLINTPALQQLAIGDALQGQEQRGLDVAFDEATSGALRNEAALLQLLVPLFSGLTDSKTKTKNNTGAAGIVQGVLGGGSLLSDALGGIRSLSDNSAARA